MRILLTRPEVDAQPLRDRLEAHGHRVLVAPLLTVAPVGPARIDTAGVQALLATSANGVRAAADRLDRRDVKLFAVGAATARAARAAGFTDVVSADGDAAALVACVAAALDPAAGPLVHLSGQAVAGDPAGDLAARGFAVRRQVVYQATAADTLPAEVAAALQAGRIDVALFYSPRTAAVFVSLLRAAGLADACAAVVAGCLSPAVADALAGLPLAGRVIAPRPDQAALLAAVGAVGVEPEGVEGP